MKKVAIVTVDFNGHRDTFECLTSLSKLAMHNYHLVTIIVDNGSKEKFEIKNSKLEKSLNFKIIRNEENLGFSGGNNVGILYALSENCDYILLVNNDTLVDANLIQELVSTLDSDNKIGVAAPKIYFAPGFEYHKSRYKPSEQGKVFWYAGGVMDWANVIGHHRGVDEVDHGQYDTPQETDFASGCCMMIKKSVLEKVGIFDDRYFLYYEESDLCERIKRAGFIIYYTPSAVVWHKNAQTAGGSGSVLQDYYITRNRLLFGTTYASMRAKLALLREGLELLFKGRRWQKKGAQDYFLKKFGKGSYSSI